MSNIVDFIKMHGLGNDFVFVDLDHTNFSSHFIQLICNRRVGIGCDQFISYNKLHSSVYKMHIYNADGSSASACGNATRCLSYLVYDKSDINQIQVLVGDRKLDCLFKDQDNIIVNMGQASFDKAWIPARNLLIELIDTYRINIADFVCVDVGNPHVVIFQSFSTPEDNTKIVRSIRNSELFSDGVNINFVHLENNDLHVKTWERGLDNFSWACGSGACASFAAAVESGFIKSCTKVHLDLGVLLMSHDENKNIIMQGSANKVFSGQYSVS